MNNTIDINCDMGESFGTYKMGADEDVIKYVSSINIACGFHAGDPLWIDYTVKLAEKYNVHIGAHPSFPDIKGFGRRTMDLTAEEIKSDIKYQVGALSIFTKNKKLQHICHKNSWGSDFILNKYTKYPKKKTYDNFFLTKGIF